MNDETSLKKQTDLSLTSNNNIFLGNNIIISGYLKEKVEPEEGYENKLKVKNVKRLVNKGINVFIDGVFVKTVITNRNGFYKDFLLAKFAGKREIKVVYDGDWEYEKSVCLTEINIINGSEECEKEVNCIGDQLEKIANLYREGLLSEEEYTLAKEKIIK
ncbi:MAG: hypothetical protein IJF83_06240 [Methanobrevibacter sp.]|nr:hypothetical protein [Methanobrevibacter sp.]